MGHDDTSLPQTVCFHVTMAVRKCFEKLAFLKLGELSLSTSAIPMFFRKKFSSVAILHFSVVKTF